MTGRAGNLAHSQRSVKCDGVSCSLCSVLCLHSASLCSKAAQLMPRLFIYSLRLWRIQPSGQRQLYDHNRVTLIKASCPSVIGATLCSSPTLFLPSGCYSNCRSDTWNPAVSSMFALHLCLTLPVNLKH